MIQRLVNSGAPRQKGVVPLFCFPYAGGSASVYGGWQKNSPDWLRICPVELPGRGKRLLEPLPVSIVELAADIASSLNAYTNVPYALFGAQHGGRTRL
jgi:surfactin synthase thioesterase subunit